MNSVGIFIFGGLTGIVLGATAVLLPIDPYPEPSGLGNESAVNPVPIDEPYGEENYLNLCSEHNTMVGDLYQLQDEFVREREWTRGELSKLRDAVRVLVSVQ
jgi:hypothetical protein